jgi:hypothetical protein
LELAKNICVGLRRLGRFGLCGPDFARLNEGDQHLNGARFAASRAIDELLDCSL